MKKILLFILILIVQQDLLATESLIIDVRTDNEWNNGYIENAKHIPISVLKKRRAKNLLIENGFTNVTNLGGIQDASTKLDKDIVE